MYFETVLCAVFCPKKLRGHRPLELELGVALNKCHLDEIPLRQNVKRQQVGQQPFIVFDSCCCYCWSPETFDFIGGNHWSDSAKDYVLHTK